MTSLRTSLIAIMMMVTISTVTMSSAFATNPYIGAYPTHSFSTHSQYTMKADFVGTPTGGRSTNVGHVFSSAGFTNSGDTDPNGWIYQNGVDLQTNDVVWGAAQVYNLSTCKYNCINADVSNLGSIGSGSGNIAYVYSTYYWSGSPHNTVNFYYEPHFNDGSAQSMPIVQYLTGLVNDPSHYFAEGTKIKSIGGTSYIVKFYQFGIESSGGSVTSTWDEKQYELTYNGATSYNTVVTNSTIYSSNARTCSCITYDSLGNPPLAVGTGAYTVANADYHDKSGSTLPAGQVKWFESSTGLGPLIQLWP